MKSRAERSKECKAELLKLAKKMKFRIKQTHAQYVNLNNYLNPKHVSYDPIFAKRLRKVNPNWLEGSSIKKKLQLLSAIKTGLSKSEFSAINPGLAACFRTYVHVTSNAFDPKFVKQVNAINSDWLVLGKTKKQLDIEFKRMTSKMPKHVRYIRPQKFEGLHKPHRFNCSTHGEFLGVPKDLMKQSWPANNSGHTFNRPQARPIVDRKYKKVYHSMNEAQKQNKISRDYLLKYLDAGKFELLED